MAIDAGFFALDWPSIRINLQGDSGHGEAREPNLYWLHTKEKSSPILHHNHEKTTILRSTNSRFNRFKCDAC